MSGISFFDLHKNEKYKDLLISSFVDRVPPSLKMEYLETINYVINNSDDFRVIESMGNFYDDEDQTLDLILPAVTRVFSKVFIDPPPLFKDTTYDEGIRLEMFQLSFDIDEFNKYLIDMLIKTKGVLVAFENLDRGVETLNLIVDNYIAGLIKNVLESYDIKSEVVKLKRDKKLKSLTNG